MSKKKGGAMRRAAKKVRVEMVVKNLGMPDPDKEAELLSRIVMSPRVYDGAPTIRGSEVPVELVLRLLGGGHSEIEIKNLLDLSEEDLQAVFVYTKTLVNGMFGSIYGEELKSLEDR